MSRLHELSARLTANSDLPSVLYEVLDATMELQGADFGDVQLYAEETGTLKIVAHRNVGQEFLDHFETVDASDTSACGLALRAAARIVIEDVNPILNYESHRGIAASTGYRGVPIDTFVRPQHGQATRHAFHAVSRAVPTIRARVAADRPLCPASGGRDRLLACGTEDPGGRRAL